MHSVLTTDFICRIIPKRLTESLDAVNLLTAKSSSSRHPGAPTCDALHHRTAAPKTLLPPSDVTQYILVRLTCLACLSPTRTQAGEALLCHTDLAPTCRLSLAACHHRRARILLSLRRVLLPLDAVISRAPAHYVSISGRCARPSEVPLGVCGCANISAGSLASRYRSGSLRYPSMPQVSSITKLSRRYVFRSSRFVPLSPPPLPPYRAAARCRNHKKEKHRPRI